MLNSVFSYKIGRLLRIKCWFPRFFSRKGFGRFISANNVTFSDVFWIENNQLKPSISKSIPFSIGTYFIPGQPNRPKSEIRNKLVKELAPATNCRNFNHEYSFRLDLSFPKEIKIQAVFDLKVRQVSSNKVKLGQFAFFQCEPVLGWLGLPISDQMSIVLICRAKNYL